MVYIEYYEASALTIQNRTLLPVVILANKYFSCGLPVSYLFLELVSVKMQFPNI